MINIDNLKSLKSTTLVQLLRYINEDGKFKLFIIYHHYTKKEHILNFVKLSRVKSLDNIKHLI